MNTQDSSIQPNNHRTGSSIPPPLEGARGRLILSDFDGTLTNRDTLIEFIRFAKGTTALLLGLLLFSPLLVMMKLHLYNNGKAKQHLFSYFFKGMEFDEFNSICGTFGFMGLDLLREGGRQMVYKALQESTPVYVVSASVDNWVAPFFGAFKNTKIVGTQIEVKDGKLTGKFLTPNCYGAEKVRRIKEAIPDLVANRSHYYIIAYGDSRGDKEMLEFADEGHYKPFE